MPDHFGQCKRLLACGVRYVSKHTETSRTLLPIRDANSEEKISESCATKKSEASLRKVKIYESLISEEDWDAHTSEIVLGKPLIYNGEFHSL